MQVVTRHVILDYPLLIFAIQITHEHPRDTASSYKFLTMPLIDTLATLWTFCPSGGAVGIPKSTVAPGTAAVKNETPQANTKEG